MSRYAIKDSNGEYWTGNKPPEIKPGRNGKPSIVKPAKFMPTFSVDPYFWSDIKAAKYAFNSYAAIRCDFPTLPELQFIKLEIGFISEVSISIDSKQRKEAERIFRYYGSTLANAFMNLKLKDDNEAEDFTHAIRRKGQSAKTLTELGIPDAYSSGVYTFVKQDTDVFHVIMAMADNFDKSWAIR